LYLMLCPYPPRQFNDFISKVGSKFEAFKQYIANGNKIPETTETNVHERNAGNGIIMRNNSNLIEQYKLQQRTNYRQIRELKTGDKVIELRKENIKLRNEIEKLKEQNTSLAQVEFSPFDVVDLGGIQLKEIEDLLRRPSLSTQSLSHITTTINLWNKIASVGDEQHILWGKTRLKTMLKNAEFRAKLSDIKLRTEELSLEAYDLGKQLLEKNIVNSHFEKNVKDEIIKRLDKMYQTGLKDVNRFAALLTDISYMDNMLFKTMSAWNINADFEAHKEFMKMDEDFEEIFKDFKPEEEDLFKQTQDGYKDTRETGDLVDRFTQRYYRTIRQIKDRFDEAFEASRHENDKTVKDTLRNTAFKQLIEDYHDKVHVIDVNKLFDSEIDGKTATPAEREAYIKYLKDHLGERGYQIYYAEAKEAMENYLADKEIQLQYLQDTDPVHAEYYHRIWVMNNSPFYNASLINEGYGTVNNMSPRPEFYYTKMVPKSKEFLDAKYQHIEGNERLLKIHETLRESIKKLSSYLPVDQSSNMHMNTIIDINKTMMETFLQDGALATMGATWDRLKKSTRTPGISSHINDVDFEISGTQKKDFQIAILKDHRKEVSEYIKTKTIEYRTSKAEYINAGKDMVERENRRKEVDDDIKALRSEWRADKLDEISKGKSWDLRKVMGIYATAALTYKHRAKIEDSVRIVDSIMNKVQEQIVSPTGETSHTSSGDAAMKMGLKNQLDAWRYWEDLFYGYPTRAAEGQTSKKVLTSEEKTKLKEYEDLVAKVKEQYDKGLISEKEYVNSTATLYTQADQLGGYKTWSAIGDDVLAYMQLKAIGWNVFSAMSNLGFGFLSNMTEAADGRRFNASDFWSALSVTFHSVGRSASFGLYETETSQKIHNLMEKWDIMNSARFEVAESKKYKIKNSLDAIMPMTMQERTEFINQATVLVAILKHEKLTIGEEEKSVWDWYNAKGELPEANDALESRLKGIVSETVTDIHGNYDNLHRAMLLKKTFLGRAAIQFKTWAAMGFHNRFSGDDYSVNSGIVKRGRYRSYANFFGEMGAIRGTLEITLQLAKKLVGGTNFEKLVGEEHAFDEVDAANMRKNLTEIAQIMSIMALGLIFKGFAFDKDDDVGSDLKFLTIFLLNQTNRMQTDIMFYTSPIEFTKLQKQALPIFSLVTDSYRLITQMGVVLTGGEDIYTTGIYKGQSKTWRYTKSVVPFLSMINRIQSSVKQENYK
jgi:hypothetical protein